MKVICIDTDVVGLTLGRHYDVISKDEVHRHSKFLLKNDLDENIWYDINPYGIIKILPLTDIFVEFLGESRNGLTKGNYYQILDRDGYFTEGDETYYFMDDFNKFVGINRVNYFGGGVLFRNTSKIRNKKLEELGVV